MKDANEKLEKKVGRLETEVTELKKLVEDLMEGRVVAKEIRVRSYILEDSEGRKRGSWSVCHPHPSAGEREGPNLYMMDEDGPCRTVFGIQGERAFVSVCTTSP